MLAELMEMSSESDGGPGSGERSEQVSGVQQGGSAHTVFVVVTEFTVGIIRRGSGFTSGWRPRLRTCPSLSKGVACKREEQGLYKI